MRCSKCNYEPTMSEMQRSPDACPKCGDSRSEASGPAGASRKSGASRRVVLAIGAVFVLAGSMFAWKWVERTKAEDALFATVDQKVRDLNGLSLELLDQSAGLTRAEFLEKAGRRVSDFDAVIAVSMSVNDSARPGVAAMLASYGKAQRALIKEVGDHTKTEVSYEIAKSDFDSFADMAANPSFQEIVAMSDQEIERIQKASLESLKGDGLLSDDKVQRFKDAASLANVLGVRAKYLSSKHNFERAQADLEEAKSELSGAYTKVTVVGEQLKSELGRDLPILRWKST